MYQHQILGIRDYVLKDKVTKTTKFLNENWRADDLQDVLIMPEKYLAPISEDQHYNLFVTMARCFEGPGRKLAEQWVIPFDIDGIDYDKLDMYSPVICEALGIKLSETGIIATGNGLHLLVGIDKPILDIEYFENNRIYYKQLCSMVSKALKEAGLPFKDVDDQIFKAGVMTRIPGSINKKPNMPERVVTVLNCFIVPIDFELKERSGLSDVDVREVITKAELKEKFKGAHTDNKEILASCSFMQFAQTEKLSERQWYNALSIAVHMKDGFKVAHEISKHDSRYDFAETNAKAEQAHHRSGPVRCSTINKTYDGCLTCPHFGHVSSPILLKGEEHIASMENGFRSISDKGAGKIQYEDLIKYFKSEHTIKVISDTSKVFSFNGKFYKELSKVYLESFAYDNIKPRPTSSEAEEFRKILTLASGGGGGGGGATYDWFTESTKGFMNFANGVLDLGSFELLPHDPKFGFTSCVPFDYNPNAECPLWLHTMDKVTVKQKELADIVQEFSGYIISGSEYRWHKALVLSGGGRNGKSTIIDVLKYCLGVDSYSSLSFSEVVTIGSNSQMEHKLANFTEETGSQEFLNVSAKMKNLISGGEFTVRRLYHDGYSIKNKTKFVLACNELPKTNDTTVGFSERLLIVPFDAYITKDSDATYDPYIQDKLKVEASGIINWMIEGWIRLQKQNGFSSSKILDESKEQYLNDNDSIRAFCNEMVLSLPSAVESRLDFYTEYKAYCQQHGMYHKASPAVYRQIKTMFPSVQFLKTRLNGAQNPIHCVQGLQLVKNNLPAF